MKTSLGLLTSLLLISCGPPPADEVEVEQSFTSVEQGLVTCEARQDTGYRNGSPFAITVVTADGKPVEQDTANAYAVMQAAAAADGVTLSVVSGFRTMAEQEYLYACHVNCNCNNCNLAAVPGTSNHQSGHALDLNTSAPGVYSWLAAHGAAFGFSRTVPSEAWHWEWWGGGPGGGPCGGTTENCTQAEAAACGGFGCGCVDHQCNGGFCPGSGCTAQHTTDCGGFGCGCADGQCNGGVCPGSGCTGKETLDCGNRGCGCVDHLCNGGAQCAGTGCTWRETHDCAAYGVNCVDHQCAGGFGPGNGCTPKETADCSATGCNCVDHACSGGAQCAGSGSTARNATDCGGFGCHSVDATCSGGACPGSGCTAHQSSACQAMGCGCVDEQCAGGSCAGTGCTLRQTYDCAAADAGCALGACVTEGGGTFAVPDAGSPMRAPDDGGLPPLLDDGGSAAPEIDPSLPITTPLVPSQLEPVAGGCSSAPGALLLGLVSWLLRRTRRA